MIVIPRAIVVVRVCVVCAVIYCVLLISSCTENPFADETEIAGPNLTLAGNLSILDGFSPQSIYVWLETFELSTYTDASGNFELELPNPSSQTGATISGTHHLYFYAADLALDSVEVWFREGEILFSQGDLDANGNISRDIQLKKILQVEMTVLSDTLPANIDSTLDVQFTVEAMNWSSVDVLTPGGNTAENNFGAAGIVQSDEYSATDTMAIIYASTELRIETVSQAQETFITRYELEECAYPQGTYSLRPFFVPVQPRIPLRLLQSLGTDVDDFDFDYTLLPFLEPVSGHFVIGAEVLPDSLPSCDD